MGRFHHKMRGVISKILTKVITLLCVKNFDKKQYEPVS